MKKYLTQVFKGEIYSLRNAENKEAKLILEDEDIRIEYDFPIKEAMFVASSSHRQQSFYDQLSSFGCVNRNDIVVQLERDTLHEYAYYSKQWNRKYKIKKSDLEKGQTIEEARERMEDYDDQRPFYYGIGGAYFEFPEDVFSYKELVFSVKRSFYFLNKEEISFEKARDFANEEVRLWYCDSPHPLFQKISTPKEMEEFFIWHRENQGYLH